MGKNSFFNPLEDKVTDPSFIEFLMFNEDEEEELEKGNSTEYSFDDEELEDDDYYGDDDYEDDDYCDDYGDSDFE